MHPQLKNFLLPFFEGNHKIVSLLKSFALKQKQSELPKASKALLKKIKQYEKDLESSGIAPFLSIAKVNEFISWGIFLNPDAKPLKKGTFIGIYSGELEIVFATETEHNHYAYDLATSIKIKKEHLPLVRSKSPPPTIDEDYSIQVNAEKIGNFTRFINHSSIDTNIDAFAKKMPDGTVAICLVTKKAIRPGEQLLSNYGGMYWAVLPIIPEPTLAKSYKMTTTGLVEKKEKDLLHYDDEAKKFLMTLRHPIEPELDDVPPHFRKFIHKAKIKTLPLSIENKLDGIEDQILEWGIPLRFVLKQNIYHIGWSVHLREEQKTIKKGALIAALSGDWTIENHKDKNKYDTLLEYKNERLFLDMEKKGNFTRLLKSSKDGNIVAALYRKKSENSLYVILKASRDILPGEQLTQRV